MSITINLDELHKRKEQGLVRSQIQKDSQLTIWNYTIKCQIERAWDEFTIKTRGLITRPDGTIHARSFDKFFNLGEQPGVGLKELEALSEIPVITTKLDGFLGLSYWHEPSKSVRIASRGSFESVYAKWATEWLWNNNPRCAKPGEAVEQEAWTFVFEILHPKRIVVERKETGLVLLTAFDNHTGHEITNRKTLEACARVYRWPLVDTHPFLEIPTLLEISTKLRGVEQEGWVLHYPTTGLRVKIKGEDYCKIHSLVIRLSKRVVWELLQKPDFEDIIMGFKDTLPREYYDQVVAWAFQLDNDYNDLLNQINVAIKWWDSQAHLPIAFRVAELQRNFPNVFYETLFTVNGKQAKAEALIWKRLRPSHDDTLTTHQSTLWNNQL